MKCSIGVGTVWYRLVVSGLRRLGIRSGELRSLITAKGCLSIIPHCYSADLPSSCTSTVLSRSRPGCIVPLHLPTLRCGVMVTGIGATLAFNSSAVEVIDLALPLQYIHIVRKKVAPYNFCQ